MPAQPTQSATLMIKSEPKNLSPPRRLDTREVRDVQQRSRLRVVGNTDVRGVSLLCHRYGSLTPGSWTGLSAAFPLCDGRDRLAPGLSISCDLPLLTSSLSHTTTLRVCSRRPYHVLSYKNPTHQKHPFSHLREGLSAAVTHPTIHMLTRSRGD